MWSECVLDATISRDGVFTFCPIEGDINGAFSVVTGLNFVGMPPDGMKLVAIVHEDGADAVNAFFEQFKDELQALQHTLSQREV